VAIRGSAEMENSAKEKAVEILGHDGPNVGMEKGWYY
jgi:hypothetical protein